MKAKLVQPRDGQKASFTCFVELTDLFYEIGWVW